MSNYTHQVDTCPCGNCHKSRVDAGTQDVYMKRVHAKAQEHKPFVCQCAKCKGYTAAIKGAADPKAIFAALGTPFDSTCPHGLPFYACMPCSH